MKNCLYGFIKINYLPLMLKDTLNKDKILQKDQNDGRNICRIDAHI